VIFVPPPFGRGRDSRSDRRGFALVVCITEGIPTMDMVKAWEIVKRSHTRLIGPNLPRGYLAGKAKVGNYAGPHPQRGFGGHRVEVGHAERTRRCIS